MNYDYPQDRKTLIKWLEGSLYGLEVLNEALNERNNIVPENSGIKKLKPKNISKLSASRGQITDDSAKDLQQWYTIGELAEECMNKFIENCPDIWENQKAFYLEPSAGEGDILIKLPKGRRFGVDLEPKHPEVKKMNFFDVTRAQMGINDETPLALIGNPPFGNVASEFFNHATTTLKPDYIAWILPNSFLSRGKRNKINPFYHLIYVMNITCCYVHKGKLYNLATMFGIWKKKDIPLDISPTILSSPDFEIVSDVKTKESIYKQEKTGALARDDKTYFWMRKVIKHINRNPQTPTFHSGQELLASYKDTRLRNSKPYDKLLGSFCIKCDPQSYNKVFDFFSSYNWRDHIGQYSSGRSTHDWEKSTRICISKQHLYGAYNNDPIFKPYIDTINGAEQVVQKEKSKITRANITKNYKPRIGGKRHTRKKKYSKIKHTRR